MKVGIVAAARVLGPTGQRRFHSAAGRHRVRLLAHGRNGRRPQRDLRARRLDVFPAVRV